MPKPLSLKAHENLIVKDAVSRGFKLDDLGVNEDVLRDLLRQHAEIARRQADAELRAHLDDARHALYELAYGTWIVDDSWGATVKMTEYAQWAHAKLDPLVLTQADERLAVARAEVEGADRDAQRRTAAGGQEGESR